MQLNDIENSMDNARRNNSRRDAKHCVHVTFDRDSANFNGLTEEDFKQKFQKYGAINKISLPRYSDQGLKGYAFVHFEENYNGLS